MGKGDGVDAFLAVVIAANTTHGEQRGGVIVQLTADVAQDIVAEPAARGVRIPAGEQRAAPVHGIERARLSRAWLMPSVQNSIRSSGPNGTVYSFRSPAASPDSPSGKPASSGSASRASPCTASKCRGVA